MMHMRTKTNAKGNQNVENRTSHQFGVKQRIETTPSEKFVERQIGNRPFQKTIMKGVAMTVINAVEYRGVPLLTRESRELPTLLFSCARCRNDTRKKGVSLFFFLGGV